MLHRKYDAGILINFTEKPKTQNMIIKGLALGLADFVKTDSCWELRIAADASQLVKAVDAKIRKKTYKMLTDDVMNRNAQYMYQFPANVQEMMYEAICYGGMIA